MKIVEPQRRKAQDWRGTFGFSREEIVQKILRNNWLDGPSSRARLVIGDIVTEPFSIGFNRFDNGVTAECSENDYRGLFTMKGREDNVDGNIQFDVLFNYQGNPRDIRLRYVYFNSCQYNGLGKKLLRAVCATAMDMDCNRILVEPDMAGSWYWTSRGALIQEWPSCGVLDERFKKLLTRGDELAPDWQKKDFAELDCIYKNMDCFGLNKMTARNDLYVKNAKVYRSEPDFLPLRRYLLNGIPMGVCIFDLEHEWTRERLRQSCDFHPVIEPQKSIMVPARPQGADATASVPAF